MEVFTRIKERFHQIGISNFVDCIETDRGKDTKGLENYAATLAKEKPTAAVVALGDMGTSSATAVVAIALEKLGIPSVYITASPRQTSRSEFICATWQNSMATNCSQQVNPLAFHSAWCCLTACANCPRGKSCKSCEYTLHTCVMADPLSSECGSAQEPTPE